MDNRFDNIETYLLGELQGEELSSIEQALRHDQELARAVADHREVMQRLEGVRVRRVVQSALQEQSPRYAGRSWWWLMVLLMAGAGVLTFIFLSRTSQPETPPIPSATVPSEPIAQAPADLPATQVAPDLKNKEPKTQSWAALAKKHQAKPSATLVRSAPTTPENDKSALEKAQEAYHKGQFRQTLQWLETATMDEEVRYYRANALFQLNRFAEAEAAFQALETSFQYRHEARWNLLLCRLASGRLNQSQARKEALALAADRNFELHERAAKLAEELSVQ